MFHLKKIVAFLGFVFISSQVEAKVILITGASGDIGLALAQHFVEQGHNIVCHYNSNKDKLVGLQNKHPGQITLISADFKKPQNLEDFWREVNGKKPVEVVINSAGVEIEDSSLSQIQDIININYLSPRLICDHAIDSFQKNKVKGTIINLGSRAAYKGLPKGYYTYADTKAALHKYSQDIARDNAGAGISVYIIAPGPVRGQMFNKLSKEIQDKCLSTMNTNKPVELDEIVSLVDVLVSDKVPSATGAVFDLMAASVAH